MESYYQNPHHCPAGEYAQIPTVELEGEILLEPTAIAARLFT
jgi:hypothetical protein